MTTEPNGYTDELEPEQQRWLRLNGYNSIEAWARDSDYRYSDVSCEWYRVDDGPHAGPVDIVGCLVGAIEAQTCEYEVTVSNVFEATDQADAVEQMVAWLQDHADTAGYRWTRTGDRPSHNGQLIPAETGFVDAEDLNKAAVR